MYGSLLLRSTWRAPSRPDSPAVTVHLLVDTRYIYDTVLIHTTFFVVLRLPFLVPFSFVWPFVLSFAVRFLYRLLRFYFCFPAFLGGVFCLLFRLGARPPPALLASLKYAYSPCVLSFFLRCWCWLIYFFFSPFPFSISNGTSFVIMYFSCVSPRFRFLLRLV